MKFIIVDNGKKRYFNTYKNLNDLYTYICYMFKYRKKKHYYHYSFSAHNSFNNMKK